MRILLATDVWLPRTNGVVRTLTSLADALQRLGVDALEAAAVRTKRKTAAPAIE